MYFISDRKSSDEWSYKILSMLTALLVPTQIIKDFEDKGNNFARLTILESLKNMPVGDVWDHYCNVSNT
ncbi:MAG: L-rhamnose isomerase, partial [Actinomycetia bacterium]|nr:L-rhamnose isomerase [Actinomycetes bacterium]